MPFMLLFALAAAGLVAYEVVKKGGTAADPLITDATRVSSMQSMVNSWCTNQNQGTPGPVNGNASDPTFMANLKLIQAYWNQQNAQGQLPAAQMALPAVFPLRTDGVLDTYTYNVTLNVWNGESAPPNMSPGIPSVTPPTTPGAPSSAGSYDVMSLGTTQANPQGLGAQPGWPDQFALPPGGVWQSLVMPAWAGGNQLITPGSPGPSQQFVYPGGGGTAVATWTDASGTLQTTYLSFIE